MQQILLYLLAVVAEQEGVVLHAVTVLSTHLHLVLTDPSGRLPIFFQRLHLAIAMCTKCHRAWDEEVFNKSQTSRVELATAQAFVSQLAYVIANCVEAGIVRSPRRYPGVVTLPSEIGTRIQRLGRPDVPWLVDEGIWPEEVELRCEMPEVLLEEHGLEGAQRVIQNAVDERVAALRAERAREGRGYLGAKRCVRAAIETRSTKPELPRSRNPTIAVGRGQRSAFFAAVERLRCWHAAYEACLERWRSGDREVVWPAGTWKMVVLHGALGEELPPALE